MIAVHLQEQDHRYHLGDLHQQDQEVLGDHDPGAHVVTMIVSLVGQLHSRGDDVHHHQLLKWIVLLEEHLAQTLGGLHHLPI